MANSSRAAVRYVEFGRSSNAKSYLLAARRFNCGVETLANDTESNRHACSFLATQALECALKAYLVSIGFTINRLTHPPLDGDLEELWITAATRGLDISPRPPDWCVALNMEHAVEFALRDPTGFGTLEFSDMVSVSASLSSLMDLVGRSV